MYIYIWHDGADRIKPTVRRLVLNTLVEVLDSYHAAEVEESDFGEWLGGILLVHSTGLDSFNREFDGWEEIPHPPFILMLAPGEEPPRSWIEFNLCIINLVHTGGGIALHIRYNKVIRIIHIKTHVKMLDKAHNTCYFET